MWWHYLIWSDPTALVFFANFSPRKNSRLGGPNSLQQSFEIPKLWFVPRASHDSVVGSVGLEQKVKMAKGACQRLGESEAWEMEYRGRDMRQLQAILPYYCNSILQWLCIARCNSCCCNHGWILQNVTVLHLFWLGTRHFGFAGCFGFSIFRSIKWPHVWPFDFRTIFHIPIIGSLSSVVLCFYPSITLPLCFFLPSSCFLPAGLLSRHHAPYRSFPFGSSNLPFWKWIHLIPGIISWHQITDPICNWRMLYWELVEGNQFNSV